MAGKNKITCIGLILLLTAAPAEAGFFGRMESGYIHFSDFNAVDSGPGQERVSDQAEFLAANAGYYRRVFGPRTAVLFQGTAQNVWLQKNAELDNLTLGAGVGLYHQFLSGKSAMLLLGDRFLRFDGDDRDDQIRSVKLNLQQPVSRQFSLHEQLYYEKGSEETVSGRYSGYGLSVSVDWQPSHDWLLSLGGRAGQNRYDVEQTVTTITRTGEGGLFSASRRVTETHTRGISVKQRVYSGTLDVTYALLESLYLRTGIGYQVTRQPGSDSVDGSNYSLALGVKY